MFIREVYDLLTLVWDNCLGFAFIQWIYFEASEKMNMSKVSFYMNLNPIFTYIGALLFLHEPLDFYQLGGIILILAGLLISKNKT